MQDDQQLAAQVQQNRASLANQYAIAEMENSARMAAMQQDAIQKAQQMEVEKAYRNSMMGLQSRELQQKQDLFDMQAQEAARQFQARQAMRAEVEAGLGKGQSPADATARAAAIWGTEAGSPAVADILNGSQRAQAGPQAFVNVKNPDGTDSGRRAYFTGQTWQLVDQERPNPMDLEEFSTLNSQISELRKQLNGKDYEFARAADDRARRGDQMSQTLLDSALDYRKRAMELRRLELKRDAMRKSLGAFYQQPSVFQQADIPAGIGRTNQIQAVTSKQQFDALPSGAIYVGEDGKKYKKP